jgi:ribosome assembly protein RRB1
MFVVALEVLLLAHFLFTRQTHAILFLLWQVWDLRSFGGNGGGGGAGLAAGSGCEPVANFRWHPRAVTSLEWHPSDESVLAVASEDDSISIWDMSVEEDTSVASAGAGGGAASQQAVVPPQLLFVHQGQTSIKELHFHPQCPGVILSTALDGYNIFKPNTNI